MNAHTKSRASRRFAALGAAAALLAPAIAMGAGSPALAVAEPTAPSAAAVGAEATGGALEWGVRASIRNYLETFDHTDGRIVAGKGASYTAKSPAAKFPLKSGSVDAAAGTAQLEFDGSLEMIGFDEEWLYFEDLRLDIADGEAVLTVDLIKSYNVKTRTDDIVLSTFPVSANALTITDEQLSFTTGEGAFPEEIALKHLPSYGGPTYAYPNNQTDPLTVRLAFNEDGTVDPGGDPGTTDPEVPATGPYGVSTGTAYSNSTARIRVEPGYAVNADTPTSLKITGTGFDPGTADRPSNIYIGFGAMSDPSNPEAWRRSQGGVSGQLAGADFGYGLTRLAISHYSSDGDVADATMDANGTWELTLNLPNKTIPSFFNENIDCVVNQCGVFAFGAHGVVKAANEAFTPVYFTGQDESGWPPRDKDDDDDDGGDPPVVVPPPVTPPVVVPPGEKACEPNGTSTGKDASSGATLEVAPSQCLGDTNQTVKLTGSGYPTSRGGETFGGVYVLFGWVDTTDANWAPTKGGSSGKSFTYANDGRDSGTFQQMVNFPGNTTGEGMPTMDDKGNWTMDFPIEQSRFTSAQEQEIDCYKVTCGVITIGAHGLPLPGGEVFTPIYFTGDPDDTGGGKPETTTPVPTVNPNIAPPPGGVAGPGAAAAAPGVAPAAVGTLAKTGDDLGRTLLFGGALLLSAGALAFAMLRQRRPDHAGHNGL